MLWHTFHCNCRSVLNTYKVSHLTSTVYREFSWPRNISTIVNQIFPLWIEAIFHLKNWLVFLAHLAWWDEGKYHFLLSRYILNNRKKKSIRSSNDPQKVKWCETFIAIMKDHVIRIEPHPCHSGINQPPLQLVQHTLSSGVKQPGQKNVQAPPSGIEVKNAWNILHPYTSSWFWNYLSTGAYFMLCIPCGFYTGPNYVITNVYSAEIYSQEDMRTKSSEQNSLPPTTR